ncbi:MAG: dephospho-CoA kinase [Balneolaceae bacterium]
MVTVGVTGTMGSGKTTLCKEWERLGAVVVYADPLAKELMQKDSRIIDQIQRSFGEKAYLPDGSLDREYLSRIAFQSGRADELNNIVHPVVSEEIQRRMHLARARGAEMFVEEAALLLLNGRPDGFDVIVLVRSGQKKQLSRVQQRDGLSEKEFLARIDRQPSEKEMEQLADYLVENRSGLSDFRKEAESLYRILVSKGREFKS